VRSPQHVRTSQHSDRHGSERDGTTAPGSGSAPAVPIRKLSVALARADGDGDGSWPDEDWPAPDDPYVGRVLPVFPPYRALREGRLGGPVDAVVLRCQDPSAAFAELLTAMGGMSVPVVVVSPARDSGTVVEVFQGGAGYLVDGDYCTVMLSSAAMAATFGQTYLSPAACAALREAAGRLPGGGEAAERMRSQLSPRERDIMELLSTGLGAQDIGLRLRLSEKTVRNNLSNIYAKLDVRGSMEAVLKWLGAELSLRV
jgi:DNA-binding NarL/FixJ family response regulator